MFAKTMAEWRWSFLYASVTDPDLNLTINKNGDSQLQNLFGAATLNLFWASHPKPVLRAATKSVAAEYSISNKHSLWGVADWNRCLKVPLRVALTGKWVRCHATFQVFRGSWLWW